MYIPKHFSVTDAEKIWTFIEANSFGQIISSVEGQLFSTHMPFLVNADRSKLVGHFATPNPQSQDIEGQEVLISLQGPHDYISPSWYVDPGVPTWNYQTAHITGVARVFRDETRLKDLVDVLTEKYEAGQDRPWQPDYNASMLGGIVGVEVEITDIQCKFKLNQNRSIEDRESVIEELEKKGAHHLAKAMRDALE
jgi:transcriptional regulator